MTLTLFGAGNIGRSFVAPVFQAAGYEITFVDINPIVVHEMNRRGQYDVVTVHPDGRHVTRAVTGVRAISAAEEAEVAQAVAETDIAATAVGAAGFRAVCRLLQAGTAMRNRVRPREPLDIILAENIPGAAAVARELLPNAGLVETSIGKMVPLIPPDLAREDPLVVYAEPYNTLIVDRTGFRGPVPEISDVMAVQNIRAYVHRKLFIHNLGHVAVAYLGNQENPSALTIPEALATGAVMEESRAAMQESAAGLRKEYADEFTDDALDEHIEDLLSRFANVALGDTVFRVGRDLRRKLGGEDRIVGAMRLLARHDLPMSWIAAVYRAATGFSATDPAGKPFPGDPEVVSRCRSEGLGWAMGEVSDLDPDNPADAMVRSAITG
jgi:mannitol-1-phosphate 5-dehydrogenase